VVTTTLFLTSHLAPNGVLYVEMPPFRPAEVETKIKAIPGRSWNAKANRWEWGWSAEVAIRLRDEAGVMPGIEVLNTIDVQDLHRRKGVNERTPILYSLEGLGLAWRAKTEGRPHQRDFKAWRRGGGHDGLIHQAVILEAGKGTGKTLGAIEEILEQLHHKRDALILILARNSNLYDPWSKQLHEHAGMKPLVDFVVLDGKRKDRTAMLENIHKYSAPIWIHNHEDLPAMGEVLASVDWDMIVMDESSRFRSAGAERVRRMTGASRKQLDAPNKIALSGAPVIKRATDIYPTLKWLGAPVGDKAAFQERFVMLGGYTGTEEILIKDVDGLNRLLDNYRFVVPKGSVIDLPRAWHHHQVKLHKWQSESYARIQRQLRSRFLDDEGKITERMVRNRLGELLRLEQVVAGFEAIDTEHFNWRDDNAKTEELFANVLPDYEGSSVMVWAHFQPEVANLCRLAVEHGWHADAYYGGQSDARNEAALRSFQEGHTNLLVLNTAKGGAGLNMPMAHTSIYYTRTFNTEDWEQSLDRNSRLDTVLDAGEVLNVDVIEAPGTVDDQIDRVLGDDVRKAAQITAIDVAAILGVG
jgi:hypothetical protein